METTEQTEQVETDFTVSDYVFMGTISLLFIVIVTFILKQIKKTFKNVNLKIGKFEIGVETKDDNKTD